MIKKYPDNSAEALWRLLTIMVCADNEIAAEEAEELKRISTFIDGAVKCHLSDEMKNVLINRTIDEWNDIGNDGTEGYIVEAAKEITNRKKQRFILHSILKIAKADGHFHEGELAMVENVRKYWGFSTDEVEGIEKEGVQITGSFEEFFEDLLEGKSIGSHQ
jgi:uncharacterized tellurite resistance protein B-like protein